MISRQGDFLQTPTSTAERIPPDRQVGYSRQTDYFLAGRLVKLADYFYCKGRQSK